jgi:formate dehydrogenase subunit delta
MDPAKLVYMADQIARNFAALGEDQAISATADHIEKFWDPRMKAQILDQGEEGLSHVVAQALVKLRAIHST